MSQATTATAVQTKIVEGRRELRFETLDDILDDAQAMATAGWTVLGNWSFGQACFHIAKTIEAGIDGMDYKAPFFIRLIVGLRKKKMLSKPFPAGFKPPRPISLRLETSDPVSDEDGVAMLEKAIHRFKNESKRSPSPVFGHLTDEEWIKLHCRHSELHFSFFKAKA
ncbi:MAG: DUF1569 domain-containing protein [Pirellulales bacterium]|nr:DUF1569 domain-containing protein [Pirellulales bacterium]